MTRGVQFPVVVLQLCLILGVIYFFDIEGKRYFFSVMCLAVAGFSVHAWLPARFRLAFFTLLSLTGIVLFLGWPSGGWVLGIGGALIAVCYLPIPWIFRVALIVISALVLLMQRVEFQDATFWPVLASMFMFRLIVYLHDLRHLRGRPPLLESLAYFFMLPNVCFTLFPVVDFKTFRVNYRAHDPHVGYQTGIEWMVRGLSHLLAYRFIKYFLMPAPHEVRDLPHLLLFLAANYALYLHISGQFHLITGMLYLFGFNLPRTHHNYFLASSFSDIWRRINIYWKDFMMKVFFKPAFFALRGWGMGPALALAALWVFLCTWLLHIYQAFWLLGEFPDIPDIARDALLWLTLGLLVAVNLQLDLSAKTSGIREAASFHLGRAIRHSCQVLGMFMLVSLFWGFWTIPALASAVSFSGIAGVASIGGCLWLVAAAMGLIAAGVIIQCALAEPRRREVLPLELSFASSAALNGAVLGLALLARVPQATALLEPQTASMLATLRLDAYTPFEARRAVQGYYEEIVDAPVRASALVSVLSGRGSPVRSTEPLYTEMSRRVDDWQGRELIPGWTGTVSGKQLNINQLGMRDREDISQKKPGGACRIALLGSSIVMGYGVADDEVFGRLLEDRLNAERREGGPRYELLNFGAGMFYAIQRRVVFERKILAFEPDALYYFAHQDELVGASIHLARLVYRGTDVKYPYLAEVVRKAGITRETPYVIMESQLTRFGPEIVLGLYHDLVEQCRNRGIVPVFIYIPVPGIIEVSLKSSEILGLAQQAGFLVVNLSDFSAGHDPSEVRLPGGDYHVTLLGHQLLTEHLLGALRKRQELLPEFARLKAHGQ